MLGTFFIHSSLGTLMLFGAVGFSWAVSSRIPFAVLCAEASTYTVDLPDQLGVIYGIHNLSICLPQIFICLGTFVTSLVSSEHLNFSVVWTLRVGGVCAFVASYLVLGMRDMNYEEVWGANTALL